MPLRPTSCLLSILCTTGALGQCGATEWRAADVSFVPQIESLGGAFQDESGSAADIMALLRSHGFNMVRLRIWVNPPDGFCDLPHTLALAARAHAAGLNILADLHYSDSWADPGAQTLPAAWAGQSAAQLQNTVETYTRTVLLSLADQGTPAAGVQIGNEVTSGMLWPAGRVGGAYESHWPTFLGLLNAAARGARALTPAPLVIVHIDRGGDNAGTRWFFDHLAGGAVEYDVIGLSYYPWWHGTLAAMQGNVADAAQRYGKRVLIAETAYPWTLEWSDNTGNLVGLPGQLLSGYPATPGGQASYLRAVLQTMRELPQSRGLGAAYWAPEWSAFPGLGSAWENLALIDFQHRALPGLAAWTCCSADFNFDSTADFFDYLDFIAAFTAQSASADFNSDGSIDFFDYLDFIDAFTTGC